MILSQWADETTIHSFMQRPCCSFSFMSQLHCGFDEVCARLGWRWDDSFQDGAIAQGSEDDVCEATLSAEGVSKVEHTNNGSSANKLPDQQTRVRQFFREQTTCEAPSSLEILGEPLFRNPGDPRLLKKVNESFKDVGDLYVTCKPGAEVPAHLSAVLLICFCLRTAHQHEDCHGKERGCRLGPGATWSPWTHWSRRHLGGGWGRPDGFALRF